MARVACLTAFGVKAMPLFLLVLAGGACATAAEDPPKQPAIDAANTWVALVDAGDYGGAWDQASSPFRGSVKRDLWITVVSDVRKPLGKVIKRELAGARYTKSLFGIDEYVVIEFNTELESKKSALEMVMPMREKDGRWRVRAYTVK
jgi:hypothetical protein